MIAQREGGRHGAQGGSRRPGAPDRRTQLLDAAEHLFSSQGVTGTTVAEITAETGVAKGTFYLYFDTKEHLLGALKERFIEQMVDRMAEAVADLEPTDVAGRVELMVTTSIAYQMAHRSLLELTTRESSDPETAQLFAEANRRIIGLIEAAIHTGANAGAVDVEDPELTAALINFAVSGAVHHFLLYEEEVDRERLVTASRRLVRRVLRAPQDQEVVDLQEHDPR